MSQVRRLKELEEENRKLKQMYAELALDNKILKDVIEKTLEPEVKKELADEILKEYNVSISRACKLMDIHRSYFYYTEKKDDSEVEQAIREAGEFGDGFWKIFQRLRRDGKTWNHKKVYRVYKQMHYEKRSKPKKRLPARVKSPLVIPSEPNTTWSIDFVSDRLQSGRTFRVLNIIDDCDRVAVGQEISMSMPAERVIKLLEKVIWLNGKPKNIRCDNGPGSSPRRSRNGAKATI